MKNGTRPIFKVGMTAIEIIVEIVRINPKIESLSFCSYAQRLNIGRPKIEPSLSRLLFHDPTREIIKLRRGEITASNLERITSSLEKETVIGMISKVKTQDSFFHIPLMDFSCEKSSNNSKKIMQFLKEIRQEKGVILFSGKSYHYYGVNLMNEKEWFNFLGDCGLSKLADNRYILHSIKDQCGMLRASACILKPMVPTVVSILK